SGFAAERLKRRGPQTGVQPEDSTAALDVVRIGGDADGNKAVERLIDAPAAWSARVPDCSSLEERQRDLHGGDTDSMHIGRKMRTIMKKLVIGVIAICVMAISLAGILGTSVQAAPPKTTTCKTMTKVEFGVSIYVGWQPWYWAEETKLLKAAG